MSTTINIEFDYDYSAAKDFDILKAAFELLYQAGWAEETEQESNRLGARWTAFSYEDIASDMFGGLVAQEMIKRNLSYDQALQTVLGNCGALTKNESLQVLEESGHWTYRGKVLDEPVRSAKQPECKDPCKSKNFPKYDDWEKIKAIAGGQNPGKVWRVLP